MDNLEEVKVLGACRCCLIVGSFKDLWTQYDLDGEIVIFGEMLTHCFSITLQDLGIENVQDQICDDCIIKLRDAYNFRKQVTASQSYSGPLVFCMETVGTAEKVNKTVFKSDNNKQIIDKPEEKEEEYVIEKIDDNSSDENVEYLKLEELEDDIFQLEQLDNEISNDDDDDVDDDVIDLCDVEVGIKDCIVLDSTQSTVPGYIRDELRQEFQDQYQSVLASADLNKIVEEINAERITLGAAARALNVPSTTLKRKLLKIDETLQQKKTIRKNSFKSATVFNPSKKDFIRALKAIRNNGMTYDDAAKLFNVDPLKLFKVVVLNREHALDKITNKDYKKTSVKNKQKTKDTLQKAVEGIGLNRIIDEHSNIQIEVIDQRIDEDLDPNLQSCIKAVTEGKMSILRACTVFKIEKHRLSEILRRKFPDNKYVVNVWKSKQGVKYYSEIDIQNAVKEIASKQSNINQAAKKHNIPIVTLQKRVNELDDKSISESNKPAKVRPQPSKDKVLSAVNAVKEGRMSCTKASQHFGVGRVFLKKLLDSPDSKTLNSMFVRKKKSYPLQVLKHCVKLVKNGKMDASRAAATFNIPLDAIRYRMSKGFSNEDDIQEAGTTHIDAVTNIKNPEFTLEQRLKLEDSVRSILTYTNATPFIETNSKYLCCYCTTDFIDPVQLRSHIRVKHLEERLSKTKEMLRPAEFKEFMRFDVLDLECTICSKALNWEVVFKHINELHGVNFDEYVVKRIVPYKLFHYSLNCALCEHKTANVKLMDKHMAGHLQNYVCECGEYFLAYRALKLHTYLKKNKTLGEFHCDICNDTYMGKAKYRAHMDDVHKIGLRSPCKYCPKRFINAYPRHLHMIEKHRDKVKDIVCECGKVFLWRPFYRDHYKSVHLKIKNHQCMFCDKSFYARNSLTRHMMIHTGVKAAKQFKCEYCGEDFAKRKSLMDHLKNIHLVINEN